MTITVNSSELTGRLGELMKLATAGAEIVVKDGDSVASLKPVQASRQPFQFDLHPGAVVTDDFADPLPDSFWTPQP
jgi:antitoxin (DNA-binding transcriptional repressor) of toxin-antitoxin stability system